MIDLHCHVLPGIDDGPPTLEGSVAMVREAEAKGTAAMVATPHVTWDLPENTAARIADAVDDLNATLRAEAIDVSILTGGEIGMSRAADLSDEELRALRLGGGPWILVECPFSPAAAGFDAILHNLTSRGHRILLGHPERSPSFQRNPDRLATLVHSGMLAQLTAGSFTGAFGREVAKVARELMHRELVHVVASDGHDAVHRPPGISEHLEAAGFGSLVPWLTEEVPRAIVEGSSIPRRPPTPEPPRRGLLSRLRRNAA